MQFYAGSTVAAGADMPSEVGMPDRVVGRALRSDLVRQFAVRARNHGALKVRGRFPIRPLSDVASKAVKAIRESVGAFRT